MDGITIRPPTINIINFSQIEIWKGRRSEVLLIDKLGDVAIRSCCYAWKPEDRLVQGQDRPLCGLWRRTVSVPAWKRNKEGPEIGQSVWEN